MASDAQLVRNEPGITGDIDEILAVGKEMVKLNGNVKRIAAKLDISVREVNKRYTQYRQMLVEAAKHDDNLSDRLAITLEESVLHLDELIAEAWANKEDATLNLEFSVVNTAIRLIKDLTQTKFDMIATMREGQDLELLAEMEEIEKASKQLIEILKELNKEYPDAAKFIHKRLMEVQGGVEIVQ